MSGGWAGSDRRAELPADWYTRIRPMILERDGDRCRACGRPASDVDHIDDKHDHRPSNLQALCDWCHKRKTSEQGNRSPNRIKVTESRAGERHPGML